MKYFIFLLLLLSSTFSHAQPTTFILVRHAEKANDGTKDPDLSAAGIERAQLLATLLKKTKIDAIYTTAYKRTHQTVIPLAISKEINVVEYDPSKMDEIDRILEKNSGGTVVIAGHSNNIPGIANYLTGRESFKNYADSEYENILIVTVASKAKDVSVVWLSY